MARDGWAILGLALATLVAETGVYGICLIGGAGFRWATLASLAAASMWVALACGVVAAGGADGIAALLRGGVVADASAITLIVLWLSSPFVTFFAAVKIYCTLLAMALLGVAAVRGPRTNAWRYIAAAMVAALMIAALATPLWIGGLLRLAGQGTRQTIVEWAVLLNPFYCIASAIAEETAFVWHEAPLLYRLTRIGDYVARPPWYAAAVCYALAALVLASGKAVVRRISPPEPR